MLVLALDMLLDRLFKMDLAQRTILLAVIAAGAVAFLHVNLVRPMVRSISDDALLLAVESRNPQLRESLISGAQLARQRDLETIGISAELAEATIQLGVRQSTAIDFATALDMQQHRRNVWLTVCSLAVCGLAAWGVNQNNFLGTWFSRNIMLSNAQWPQRTYLEIVGAVDGVLVVPRGADHRQLVNVLQTSADKLVAVSLEIENPNGKTFHSMKPTGKLDGRQHVLMMHNVSTEARIRASGGDDITDWVDIRLVEPPSVVDLQLKAILPAYTGLQPQVLVGPGPHSLLEGSALEVRAEVNKQLKECLLRSGEKVFEMTANGANQSLYTVTIPGTTTIPGAAADEKSQLLAGGQYEFSLIDPSGLVSMRPTKFSISIKEDAPPKIRANLLGISGLVVPRAMVPVSHTIVDDYGLTSSYFDCGWRPPDEALDVDANDSGQARHEPAIETRQVPIATYGRDSAEIVRQVQDVSVLDLLPMNLQPGTSLRFALKATDNRPGTTNTAGSNEFLLRIVTDEELREDLLRREIEQRTAFQRSYETQLELVAELQAIAASRPEEQTLEAFLAERQNRLIDLARDQKVIGTSIDAVANRYEEFLVEVKNNRLADSAQDLTGAQTLEVRFDKGIIQPIRALDANQISLAMRHLDNCRAAAASDHAFLDAVGSTTAIQQQILEEMKTILDAMVDSENFQEIVNKLLEVRRGENQIKSEIERRNKPDKPSFDEDEIFDDD
jgi:hypothetical protein